MIFPQQEQVALLQLEVSWAWLLLHSLVPRVMLSRVTGSGLLAPW